MLKNLLLLAPLALAALVMLGALNWHVGSGVASPGATERVSVDSAGNQANDGGYNAAISADNRYVAFQSTATNLVPGDTNGTSDVFVHDRQTGVTERVSVDSAGNQANDGGYNAAISADGRYVAFQSLATNLVPADTNGKRDVFVHDRLTGASERVSVDSAGNQGDGDSGGGQVISVSADGRYVAFESLATNLVPGDTNGALDVFVHDRQTGVTARVSVDSAGNQTGGGGFDAISADGRYVAFGSQATDVVPGDTNGKPDVFVHDRQTGATERVSVDSAGNQGDGISGYIGMIGLQLIAISADGRYVAFGSQATNLVPGDTNGKADVFVHDRQTGATERVSVDSAGNQGDGGGDSGVVGIRVSADGRYVAFESFATNLVPGDTNAKPDVFVHDRQTGATERVSVDSAGDQGNDQSHSAALSADGRYVAFESFATNLVVGDTNGKPDVFVHDRGAAATATPTATPSPGPTSTETATATPNGTESWGDFDCLNGITIGDAQKIARYLINLSITQEAGCPTPNQEVTINGTPRMWGDLDCMNGLTIGDAQKTARKLINLPVSQAQGCPAPGDTVQVQT